MNKRIIKINKDILFIYIIAQKMDILYQLPFPKEVCSKIAKVSIKKTKEFRDNLVTV